jgi:3-oxoacyl-[acyl-carrier-protein] synthase III
MGVKITNIKIYLPERVLDNEELSNTFKTISADEIFKRTGIKKRYVSGIDEIASDMAVSACDALFLDSNINKSEIDFLIFCSEGFDFIAPATSCILQDRLKLSNNIGALDIPYGCSGFVYGLGIANSLLVSGMAKKILFITSDIPTKVISKDNFELRSLFSDIASANLIEKSEDETHFIFGTDGSGYQNLIVDYSGFRNPSQNTNSVDLINGEMRMNSTEIFRFAIKNVPKHVDELLLKYQLTTDDIDLFVFHQASYYLLEIIRRKIKVPKEKFFVNLESFGNSVSSSIPLALYDAEQKGLLKKGMKVMLVGFGIGYSWAGTIIKY